MSSWVCPSYSHCDKAYILQDSQGIPSLNSVVSIADQSHIGFCSGILRDHPQKSPLKLYYVKYMGIKSDDTAFLGEYVIISYLLCAGTIQGCNLFCSA